MDKEAMARLNMNIEHVAARLAGCVDALQTIVEVLKNQKQSQLPDSGQDSNLSA